MRHGSLRFGSLLTCVVLVGAVALAACGTAEPMSLSDAVAAGDTDAVRAMLMDGVDPEGPLVAGLTPLQRAANRNDTAMVEVLLDGGADVDGTGTEDLTALHVAAGADAAQVVTSLLVHGADIGRLSANGMNPLHHAADRGAVEAISLLVAAGLPIDGTSEVIAQGHGHPRDVGATALGIAVRAGHLDAVARLLDLGAAVDDTSMSGNTPLLVAVYSNQSPDLVRLLLDAGADPSARGVCDGGCAATSHEEGGLTALEWAERLDRADLIPLLADR